MPRRDRKLRAFSRELKEEARRPLRDDPEGRHLFDPNHEGFQSGFKEAARRLDILLNELGFDPDPPVLNSSMIENHKVI